MQLEIENLTKKFQDTEVVSHLSYMMEKGVYGLLGVNGAGKTTLMRMLCTLLKPTEGRILLDGEDIFEMGAAYRKILGYLPQDFGFYPDLTVKDYLLYIASIKGVHKAAARKRVKELLDQVGLSKAADKKMKKLSGGMKRRAGIAQAMLNHPAILILDEPTAGLDPNERIRFRNLISELAQDRLVLLSTHIVSDVEYIANEILLMKDGALLYTGTPEAVIAEIPERVWRLTVPSYFYGKLNGIDIREHGSGNSGTTNALRVLGKKAGAIVLLGDCAKCILAVCVTRLLYGGSHPDTIYLLCIYAAAGAILGHNFPFYMGFKGGKGIAATAGLILSLHPYFIPMGVIVFFGILFTTHYVSLGSLLVYVGFMIEIVVCGQLGVFEGSGQATLNEMYTVSLCLAVMAFWKHRENIRRLIHGEERKTYLTKKNEK